MDGCSGVLSRSFYGDLSSRLPSDVTPTSPPHLLLDFRCFRLSRLTLRVSPEPMLRPPPVASVINLLFSTSSSSSIVVLRSLRSFSGFTSMSRSSSDTPSPSGFPPGSRHFPAFQLPQALATFVSHKEDGFDDAQLDFPAYDSARWVSGNIHYRARPSSFHPIPIVDTFADPFDYNLILSRIYEEERRECNRRNAEARPACTHAGHTPMDSSHDCTEKPHKSILCPSLPIVHEAEDAADAAVVNAALNASFRVIKKMPTRRSYRVLASHLAEGPLVPDEFFVKEEERALSECSSGSMPSLVTPSVTGGSTTV
ncbi:hypothetical protein DFH06DRAFT_1317092 [Mycena polygramma]|nr:hypothetical protein DFH06DRAFT_1317092 [Mycena polygramma]